MKTFTLTLTILLSAIMMGFSTPNSNGISEQISSQLSSFQMNTNEPYNGNAIVTFKVGDKGELNMVSIETNDPALKRHLEKSFSKIIIKNSDSLSRDITYEMPVVLKIV